jgi:hypothetical protein
LWGDEGGGSEGVTAVAAAAEGADEAGFAELVVGAGEGGASGQEAAG